MNKQLSPQVIYQYDRHLNIPWNIVQYKPVREYFGLTIKSLPGRKVTEKGFYMDQHIKNVKTIPSPCQYQTKQGFDQTHNIKKSIHIKTSPDIKKNTYLDEIQKQGKIITIGVGSYNIKKTQKEQQSQIKKMKRRIKLGKAKRITYFQQKQALSNMVPGSGNYNPHQQVVHLKKNKTKPQFWRQKDRLSSQKQLKLKKKIPGPTTYRPSSAGTFDQINFEAEKLKKRRSLSLNKSFGTDAKFQYCRPIKRKIFQKKPGPTSYDLQIKWRGKNDETKKIGWNSFVSTKSVQPRVYSCN